VLIVPRSCLDPLKTVTGLASVQISVKLNWVVSGGHRLSPYPKFTLCGYFGRLLELFFCLVICNTLPLPASLALYQGDHLFPGSTCLLGVFSASCFILLPYFFWFLGGFYLSWVSESNCGSCSRADFLKIHCSHVSL